MKMALLSLTFYIAYVGVAFGLRVWLHKKRTGSSGVWMPWKQPGVMGKFATALFTSAVLCFAAGPLADLAGVIERRGFENAAWLDYFGVALAVSGFVLTLVGQAHMGDAWRIGVNSREVTPLVTAGVFAHVRNPIFAGAFLGGVGLLLMTPNLISIVGTITLWLAIQLQVRWFEEPYLARTHGSKFLTYAERTGRFFPGVGLFYDLKP